MQFTVYNVFAFSGWGRTIGGGAAADTLQQAELPVVEHSTCSNTNSRPAPVDEATMVCAGSGIAGQAGGCQGDSGGPFVFEENGKWVLRGAVSWKMECAQPTSTLCLFVSAILLTGSIRKCLVAEVVAMAVAAVVRLFCYFIFHFFFYLFSALYN